MILLDLVYSLSEPDFRVSFKKAITWLQISRNVDITRISNGHISVLHEAIYSYMVEHVGSTTCAVQIDVTLTRSKVKVEVMGLLTFRKLPKIALF